MRILLADDEPSIRLTVGDALTDAGYDVDTADDGERATKMLGETEYDLIITDIRMPKTDGLTLFRKAKESHPETDVIMITAYGDVNDAVTALKEGAYDYITKPFDHDELVLKVERIAQRHSLQQQLREAREILARRETEREIVGSSPAVVRMVKRVTTIARSDASVVITGESGTGKELVARALHSGSSRAEGAFVTVNCAAFPETLIEAELFGHEKGAFTGAMRRREGRFKAADGGTLFLDEVGEIPPMVQAKLLRVLQDGIIEPLGSNEQVKVDVRIVSATHRNLKQQIADGNFREDLYYRLNVLDVHVPPLRERRGDLPLLVEHFAQRYGKEPGDKLKFSPRAWAALMQYSFPGNVRELEHAVQHALALSGEAVEVDLEHLPSDIAGATPDEDEGSGRGFEPLGNAMRQFEREYLLRALDATDGKKTKAAELLGISRKNLWEKLKGHGISDSDL